MTKSARRPAAIRAFILAHVAEHPRDIAALAAAEFGITRQGVHRHLANLVSDGSLAAEGRTRGRTYKLRPLLHEVFTLEVSGLREDEVWRDRVLPLVRDLPENVRNICDYGFGEILNNVIDHSESPRVVVGVSANAAVVEFDVADFGVGIFNKIMAHFHLDDERQAMLALSKGKLTTDPERHSGEGLFFTRLMFDRFTVRSGHFAWAPHLNIFDEVSDETPGTFVSMEISRFASRTSREVFARYSTDGGAGDFSRTVVPVRLARYEGTSLVSRSQAKRLLARVDRFATVILDFAGIDEVGQGFADEIFRVWQNAHPGVSLLCMNATAAVMAMVNRARKAGERPPLDSIQLDH